MVVAREDIDNEIIRRTVGLKRAPNRALRQWQSESGVEERTRGVHVYRRTPEHDPTRHPLAPRAVSPHFRCNERARLPAL